jgi:hypothetical protein
MEFHAVVYLELFKRGLGVDPGWLGIANGVGGSALILFGFNGFFGHTSHTLTMVVITLGMFSTAAAFFTFQKEMIMRRQRVLP